MTGYANTDEPIASKREQAACASICTYTPRVCSYSVFHCNLQVPRRALAWTAAGNAARLGRDVADDAFLAVAAAELVAQLRPPRAARQHLDHHLRSDGSARRQHLMHRCGRFSATCLTT